jgi:NAD(P)-dependent dehydrogenase (short-subunit alcohol dehydrogenase family)
VQTNVADEASVAEAVRETVAKFGSLDCAFNNAGIGPQHLGAGMPQPTAELSLADFRGMLDVNLTGVFLCLKHEIAVMLAQKTGGAIVNTASIAGLKGLPLASSYTAAKHGVVGLTKVAAMEYARAGIRVNAICPGFVNTAIVASAGDRSDAWQKLVPQRRLGEPEEIAETVVMLLSSRTSFVTGASWSLDGGLSA